MIDLIILFFGLKELNKIVKKGKKMNLLISYKDVFDSYVLIVFTIDYKF